MNLFSGPYCTLCSRGVLIVSSRQIGSLYLCNPRVAVTCWIIHEYLIQISTGCLYTIHNHRRVTFLLFHARADEGGATTNTIRRQYWTIDLPNNRLIFEEMLVTSTSSSVHLPSHLCINPLLVLGWVCLVITTILPENLWEEKRFKARRMLWHCSPIFPGMPGVNIIIIIDFFLKLHILWW